MRRSLARPGGVGRKSGQWGRRAVVAWIAVLGLAVMLAACGGGGGSTPTTSGSVMASSTPGVTTVAPTLDPALHDRIPVDHIVILMQENHSFDNYFGQLKMFDPTLDVEAEPLDASNPDPTGGPPIAVYHETSLCASIDLNHSWAGTHEEYDGGTMQGFTKANANPIDPSGKRAMGYYTEADIPFYYSLFDTFAIGDRYFSSLMGPTQPNRFYLYSGTSFGRTKNGLPPSGDQFSQKTIFELLDEAGVSWKIYSSQFAYSAFFAYVRSKGNGRVQSVDDYYTDAAAGTLPNVAFVDPAFAGPEGVESDEHPPADVQVGQKFVADVIGALFASPDWPSSALFLEYDEHGGYYDHVPPPTAVPPDDIAPVLDSGDPEANFDQLGIRVPFAVVSPFAKQHYVSHTVYDHTSLLAFIEARFGLAHLTARDAAASAPLEMFDFADPPFATPPSLTPAVVEDARLCGSAANPFD